MLLTSILLWFAPNAQAFNHHQLLMERIFETRAALKRLYPYQRVDAPCSEAEQTELKKIGEAAQIDATKIPLFSTNRCKPGDQTFASSVNEIMTSTMIDEPDMGMDQNLPASFDPNHERKWMGGDTGPTSQGFRHMYFAGFNLFSPVNTLQIPFSRIGEALNRMRLFHDLSDEYAHKNQVFWAARTLLWELHYLQDLHQPFHVLQVPSPRLLPWKKLFSGFVAASTHSISNYHYAYEGLVEEWVKDSRATDVHDCFDAIDDNGKLDDFAEVITLAHSTGNDLGYDVYRVFGDAPKTPEMDLPNAVGQIDYYAYAHMNEPAAVTDEDLKDYSRAEKASYLQQRTQWQGIGELKNLTCELLKSLTRYSWIEMDHLFSTTQPNQAGSGKSNSKKTGK